MIENIEKFIFIIMNEHKSTSTTIL